MYIFNLKQKTPLLSSTKTPVEFCSRSYRLETAINEVMAEKQLQRPSLISWLRAYMTITLYLNCLGELFLVHVLILKPKFLTGAFSRK